MIVSRDLKKGLSLQRGKEILTVKSLIKTGRSCTAVCLNAKGKTENLNITYMWNHKMAIVKEKKVEKKITVTEITNPKKQIVKAVVPTKTATPLKKELVTPNGITNIYFKPDGTILCSSWQRKK